MNTALARETGNMHEKKKIQKSQRQDDNLKKTEAIGEEGGKPKWENQQGEREREREEEKQSRFSEISSKFGMMMMI